jgi:predicted nucleic acid-binding protein
VTGIVIDASVTLSWCFPDEQTPLSLNVLDLLKRGEQALVPAFWSLEVLNTLLLGERKGRITALQTKSFIDTLRVISPILDNQDHAPGCNWDSRRAFRAAAISASISSIES